LRGGLFCRLAAGRAQRFFGAFAGTSSGFGEGIPAPPRFFLCRKTRRSLFLPAGISGSVPASPAEKPRKLLFQNPEWLFSLRFFRISPGFSLSLKV
jgi:hypothetical protein